MLDTLDLDRGDRRALDRREQSTTDRVTDRRSEPALEGGCVKLAVFFRQTVLLDIQPARHLKICPIIACHIFCSFYVVRSWPCPRAVIRKNRTLRARLLRPTQDLLLTVKLNDQLFV